MARLLVLSVSALALTAASAANAADLPRPAPLPAKAPVMPVPLAYNWTGFYIGANGGFAWADKCWNVVQPAFAAGSDGCDSPRGGLAGGQVGFNWQLGQFVLGVEGSGDWAKIVGNHVGTITNVGVRSEIDAIWAATARLGFAWDAALLYVKGGGAWTSDKFTVLVGNDSNTRSGWTIGGGLEWGFAQNWSVAVEYAHYDFGTKGSIFTGPAGPFLTENIKQTVDAVTARLNWRFGPSSPVVARY